ncbi:DUF6035 family protein [Methylocystis heyeri]|uniref:Competence protein n=1 Tax=Methylocystis heyeri TaxID=391905 RepID=A0A6B8KGE5_9HYPH|nr:DUF6035 family protein [Methylocystis heyeri]QGM47416.1 hypothetical protein H2LOC_017940 [Methylocystis heyeri]
MKGETISIDPLAHATPVDDPEIIEIQDLRTGELVNSQALISSYRYGDFIVLRGKVREHLHSEVPFYACALCATPVYIVANQAKRFFFRHLIEDGSCSARTRGELSQDEIAARKYHGQRESEAHKHIKNLIEKSLNADPVFETTVQEKVWRSARDPKARRQPDVQTESPIFGRVAFEVQLSTTFLSVVVARRAFYREQGALLVWVFGNFMPDYRRLMVDDILFPNNSNLFVVDDETTGLSKKRGVFLMRCIFRRPVRNGSEIIDEWNEEIVAFGELQRDIEAQTAFFFDYAKEEKRLRDAIDVDAAAARLKEDDALRDEFLALWKAAPQFHSENSGLHARWKALSETLAARGIKIPDCPNSNSGFRALLNGILSAEEGKPVGWDYEKLIQVAHCIFDRHKPHLFAFGCALQHYGSENLLEEQDKKEIWAKRKSSIKEALRVHNPAFIPDPFWLPALLFLFPEIGRRVKAYLDNIDLELFHGL